MIGHNTRFNAVYVGIYLFSRISMSVVHQPEKLKQKRKKVTNDDVNRTTTTTVSIAIEQK